MKRDQSAARVTGLVILAGSLSTAPIRADHIEETVVIGSHDRRQIDVAEAMVISPDPARFLSQAPGANVNGNGPLTGIPQYRGMYGERVAVSIDSAALASAGPNAMDPPLSYAGATQLASLELYRGIAPVSVAQETIGGAIKVETRRGEFTDGNAFALSGRIDGSAQSATKGYQLGAGLDVANRNHKLSIAAAQQGGEDGRFPDGDITPTEYERGRIDLGYGWRDRRQQLQLDYSRLETRDAGTPSLPMDIDTIDGDLYSLNYSIDVDPQFQIDFTLFGSELDHGMTNYHLRQAPPESRWRRNIAASDNAGFKLESTLLDGESSWIFGVDALRSSHDSDIGNPNNPMFFVQNFNNAEREVLGVFVERQQAFSGPWSGEFGIRFNQVTMDADEVDGTPAMMMPPAMALRDAFNAADREQRDYNFDAVAKAWFSASDSLQWYGGAALKHRSPSYQERYLWLPLQSTGGLADGFTYTGNIDLKPEESTQLEFGFDYQARRLSLSPRFFYNRVHNYIQGTPSEVVPALTFVRMMNQNNGTMNPDPLQFNNVDAELYGFDMDWRWAMGQQWQLSGLVSYVRGKRRDIDDSLYRIAPPNATIRLDYRAAGWSAGVESVLYAAQDDISETNAEQETAGYGVVNASASWQATSSLQLAAGVDNLFDKRFEDHLAGYNRAVNPDLARGERLPGLGINLFARVSYTF